MVTHKVACISPGTTPPDPITVTPKPCHFGLCLDEASAIRLAFYVRAWQKYGRDVEQQCTGIDTDLVESLAPAGPEADLVPTPPHERKTP